MFPRRNAGGKDDETLDSSGLLSTMSELWNEFRREQGRVVDTADNDDALFNTIRHNRHDVSFASPLAPDLRPASRKERIGGQLRYPTRGEDRARFIS